MIAPYGTDPWLLDLIVKLQEQLAALTKQVDAMQRRLEG